MNAKNHTRCHGALVQSDVYSYANTEAATNYANPEHWLALPLHRINPWMFFLPLPHRISKSE